MTTRPSRRAGIVATVLGAAALLTLVAGRAPGSAAPVPAPASPEGVERPAPTAVPTAVPATPQATVRAPDATGAPSRTAAPSAVPSRAPAASPAPTPVPVPGGGPALVTLGVGSETYRVLLTGADDIEIAQALLRGEPLPGIPNGGLVLGSDPTNPGYDWHVEPDTFEWAEITMEECDGRPSDVGGPEWTSDRFCPWGARVLDVTPFAGS